PAARLGRDGDRQAARDAGAHRHDLAAAALPALLRPREGYEEPAAVRREGDPRLPAAGAQDGGGGVTSSRSPQSKRALGALLTVLAMLCFASMDAIAKWLVADYAIGQMMWIRYGVFCVFAWLVVRRRGGVRAAFRTARPGLQAGRALLAVVESAVFVLAFRYLPLADTHSIAATSPLIVIALGALFLGEKAGVARWLAVLAGFTGVLLIVRPGFRTLDWPLLIPVAGAILWGSYQILTRLSARADSPDT